MQITRWDQEMSTEESNDILMELALCHCRRISDTSLRLYLYLLIEREEYGELGGMSLDYTRYSPQDCKEAAQISAYYSKRVDIDLGIDRERVAYDKFVASERLCAETNEIFKLWCAGKFQFPSDVEAVLFSAQRKIAACLGDVPNLGALKGRFGPGATTQVKRRTASARHKLSQELACSEKFLPLLNEAWDELPFWWSLHERPISEDTVGVTIQIHDGKLHFVPKNAKTDRSIVVEPSLNSFFQLGIGGYIARRLRARGVDITDQTVNQKLARQGSIDGGIATLDLTNASDTVARELVAHLLPPDWYSLLDSLRTETVEYKGCRIKLHKFSSMGNGFTFPLETLIFWALAKTATELTGGGTTSVYGDDLIVPTDAVVLLSRVLNACGFTLNEGKSYWSGPFRESCGKDYHSGILIRPVYVKDRLLGADLFRLHNFFVREGDNEIASAILRNIPTQLQLWGPDGYGDGHLLCGNGGRVLADVLKPYKRDLGWSGFIFDTFTWCSRKSFIPQPGDYVFPSYSVYVSDEPRGVDRTTELVVKLGQRLATEIFGRECVRRCFSRLESLKSDETPYSRKTRAFGVVLPGTRGYKRVRIYTLQPD